MQYPDTFHAVNFHHLSAIHLFIFCLCFGALSDLMRISLAGDTPTHTFQNVLFFISRTVVALI